jgi:hypothetical protein
VPNPDGSMTAAERTVARSSGDGADPIVKFARETTRILKDGEDEFGAENFTRARLTVAQKLGAERFTKLCEKLVDRPDTAHRLLDHLGKSDGDLDRLVELPPERHGDLLRDLERDRLGVRHIPTTTAAMRKDDGYMSKADFNSPLSDMLSDAAWHANFDRHRRKLRK